MDLQSALAPNVLVEFVNARSASETYSTRTDVNGRYSVRVPANIYEIRLKRGVDYANFNRATIGLTCSDSVQINLYLLPECVSYGCTRAGYQFDLFTGADSKFQNLVIAYASKKKAKGRAIYENAVVTFGGYTLNANEVIQDTRTKVMWAKGPGWIENGQDRKIFNDRLEIDFASELLNTGVKIKTLKDKDNMNGPRKQESKARQ